MTDDQMRYRRATDLGSDPSNAQLMQALEDFRREFESYVNKHDSTHGAIEAWKTSHADAAISRDLHIHDLESIPARVTALERSVLKIETTASTTIGLMKYVLGASLLGSFLVLIDLAKQLGVIT